jgi:hypothetical protein
VRQPLAEMKVQPGDEADQRAAKRFADQICDELNVKKLTLHEANGRALLNREVKANPKTLGPKFGSRMKEVQATIAAADPTDLAAKVQGGQPFDLSGFSLDPADLFVQLKAPDGWAGVADRGTEVIIDTQITEELAREGMARDVVRQVQDLRKTANLNMEDRIALVLQTDAATLQAAIQVHKDYIANETLTVEWPGSLDGEAATADVKIDGQPLAIKLRPVERRKILSAPGPKKAKPAAKPSKPKARSKRARKSGTPTKAKPKASARPKTSDAGRKKARAVQAVVARKNSKPGRAPKNATAPRLGAKAKAKKAGIAKKGAIAPIKSRKAARSRR